MADNVNKDVNSGMYHYVMFPQFQWWNLQKGSIMLQL